ncbi:MAG: RCC1 domain-containing protein, partial [Acidimicrobiaceae bacterium]|nr:RCC1 domain-containing protein [Acidimicrobiaceae bacterium]
HSCGLRTDDTITCWGDNEYGQADAPAGTTTTTTTTTVPPTGSPTLTAEVTECVAQVGGTLGYDVTISGTVHANRAVSDVTVSRWEPDPLSGYAGDFQWTRDRLGSLSAGASKNFSISTVYPHYIRHPNDGDCQVWVNFSEE